MLKFLILATFTPYAMILITAKVALTQQPPSRYQFPVIRYSSTNMPVCYIQTQDGTIQDLSSICGKTPVKPNLPDITSLKKQICGNKSNCPVDVMIMK
jgi:hypothetical protein